MTPEGIGGVEALRIFGDVLAPACISVDHPRFLSFVPAAPTDASILFDLVVGASSIYGGSWLEGAGAIFAENEALRWIADLAGLPASAGGVFVSGGTAGNLERAAGGPLAVARPGRRCPRPDARPARRVRRRALVGRRRPPGRWTRTWSSSRPTRPAGSPAAALEATVDGLDASDRDRTFAVVATAGTTNTGVIDDLRAAADAARRLETWLHVDGAYGGAALAAPSVRDRFAGVEHADSFIVDPHKWLFAPFDSCALIYRDPEVGRRAHTQHAEYLDVLHADHDASGPAGQAWNASDYAHHLSRRARGLPLWFSLATHGTDAYRDAIETTLRVAREGAELVRAARHLELVMDPELSIVLFRRLGWDAPRYHEWSDRQLAAGAAFVTPSAWGAETVLRWCIVNPQTTVDDLAAIVSSLE